MNNKAQSYEIPDDESEHYSEDEIVDEATDSDDGGVGVNREGSSLQVTGNAHQNEP
jgi:hypothetical protein